MISTSAALVDFALMSALQIFDELADFRQKHDVSCIFNVNQEKRLDEAISYLDKLKSIKSLNFRKRIRSTVGDFHVRAHQELCHTMQNGTYREGDAVNDGEGMERIWARNTDLSDRTKEMNPGHRVDELTVHIADQNVQHVHSMRE